MRDERGREKEHSDGGSSPRSLLDWIGILDERLVRVENSAIFRFLRWLGRAKSSRAAATDSDYTRWVEEVETFRRLTAASCEPLSRNTSDRIAILLNTTSSGRNIERTLKSLCNQSHQDWDLLIQLDSDVPDPVRAWIGSARNDGHEIVVVPNQEEMHAALAQR